MNEKKFLKTAELAELWRKEDPATISNYALDGRIPGAFKIGNEWLFPIEDLRLLPKPSTPRAKRRYGRRGGPPATPTSTSEGVRTSVTEIPARSPDEQPPISPEILKMRREVAAALEQARLRERHRRK